MNLTFDPSLASIQSLKSFPHLSSVYQISNYKDSKSVLDQMYSDSYTENFNDIFNLNCISQEKALSPINQVLQDEAYSFDVEKFASKFLDALFLEAKSRLAVKESKTLPKRLNYCPLLGKTKNDTKETEGLSDAFSNFSEEFSTESHTSYVVDWPKISDFNIKLGLEKLENYVSQWKRSEDWVFCVEFLGFECEDCANIFVFEVEWSKPTLSYPVPQVTASVFFGLEVFKMLPYNHDRNVDVSYIFECSNIIHKPGKFDFQEKWLQDILDAKLKFFKSITFAIPKGICEEENTQARKDSYVRKLKQSFI